MNSNPLALLPPKVRAVVYGLAVLAGLALGAWQAADGDWLKAAGLFVGALVGGTALSNVDTSEPWNDEEDEEESL